MPIRDVRQWLGPYPDRNAACHVHRVCDEAISSYDGLAALDAFVDSARDRLLLLGDVLYRHGPQDCPKQHRHLVVETTRQSVELLLWSSGEAEFNYGSSPDGLVDEHHQIANPQELDALIERFLRVAELAPEAAE